MSTVLITKPTKEPVTLDAVKEHLSIIGNDFDGYLSSMIFVARRQVESYLNRALVTQTWDYYLDGFSNVMRLPKGQLQSVTTVKYIDTDGAVQTLAGSPIEYSVDTYSDPGKVELAYGQSWPGVRGISNSVVIRFIAGYGDSGEDVPEEIQHAIKILIATYEQNREAVSQFQLHSFNVGNSDVLEALLWPYKILTA